LEGVPGSPASRPAKGLEGVPYRPARKTVSGFPAGRGGLRKAGGSLEAPLGPGRDITAFQAYNSGKKLVFTYSKEMLISWPGKTGQPYWGRAKNTEGFCLGLRILKFLLVIKLKAGTLAFRPFSVRKKPSGGPHACPSSLSPGTPPGPLSGLSAI
jgi:hypothetical protein